MRWPFHGPKKRWHNEVVGDLRVIGVRWYQDCKQWSETYFSGIDILAQNRGTVTCAANIFPT